MGRERAERSIIPTSLPRGPALRPLLRNVFINDGDEEMKSLLGKLENDTQSDETEREEDVFTWVNGQGVFDCRYPGYVWD